MKWRLTQVEDDSAESTDLSDDELIGISVILAHRGGAGIYWSALQKIQPAVKIAIDRKDQP